MLICVDSVRVCDTQLTFWSVNVTLHVFSKFHHRTGNESTRGREEVQLYFLTSAPDGVGGQRPLPPGFTRKERDPLPIVCF